MSPALKPPVGATPPEDGPPALPSQPTLRRLRRFGVRPKRDLGQNFLIDFEHPRRHRARRRPRARRCRARDRRRARGAPASTSRRAARTCTWSRSTAASSKALEDALHPHPNHDAARGPTPSRSTSAAPARAPTKVAANLPYGVAARRLLRTVEELPAPPVGGHGPARGRRARRPPPAKKIYGAPSALAQAPATCRTLRGPRGRLPPGAERRSVLVAEDAPARPRRPRCAPRAAGVADPRKALARSLALSPGPRPGCAAARAESSSSATPPMPAPSACPRRLPRPGRGAQRGGEARQEAPAKLNLCLFLGRARRSDGRHELVTCSRRGPGRPRRGQPAPGDTGRQAVGPGVGGRPADNLAAAALRAFRERAGWDCAARSPAHRQAHPGGRRAGRRVRPTSPPRCGWPPARPTSPTRRCSSSSPPASAPTSPRSSAPAATWPPAPERSCSPLPAPEPYGVVLLPAAAALSTADVFGQADRYGGFARAPADLTDRLRTVRAAAADLPGELIVNDLEPASRALCPAIDEALLALRASGAEHAVVRGSGPDRGRALRARRRRPRGRAGARAAHPASDRR